MQPTYLPTRINIRQPASLNEYLTYNRRVAAALHPLAIGVITNKHSNWYQILKRQLEAGSRRITQTEGTEQRRREDFNARA